MHEHLHIKRDGRELYLFSQFPRDYRITHDLEPLDQPPMPQRRWHPLRHEWVLYNPSRNVRTFHPPSGYNPLAPVPADAADAPGEIPTDDFEIAVFENRWPGLAWRRLPADAAMGLDPDTQPAFGRCEVVVYGTDKNAKLYELSVERAALLLAVWGARYQALCALRGEDNEGVAECRKHGDEADWDDREIAYVLPFESRGAFVGVTLPHPHGQIYSFGFIPPIIARQAQAERDQGVLKAMIDGSDGGVHAHCIAGAAGQSASLQVPRFARYPYELWVMPPRVVAHPGALSDDERLDMAARLQDAVRALDGLFDSEMPYCLWVSLPPKGFEDDWPFHIQIWPMQRSAGKMKYLASVEQITASFLVDVMPEDAARSLAALIP